MKKCFLFNIVLTLMFLSSCGGKSEDYKETEQVKGLDILKEALKNPDTISILE